MAALQIDIMRIKQLLLLKSKSKSNRKIALVIGVNIANIHSFGGIFVFPEQKS